MLTRFSAPSSTSDMRRNVVVTWESLLHFGQVLALMS